MKSLLEHFSRSERIYLLLVCLLAVGMVLAASSKFGLGVSTDGLHYLAAADNLADGIGLMDYKGAPLDSWAPLLPALMAGVHLVTGLSTLNSAALINILSVVASVLMMALFLKEMHLRSPMWFYAGTAAFALLSSSIALAANVATEPLFVVLILLFLWWGRRYFEDRAWSSLLLMGLAASLAPVLRWVGVTLAFTGVLFLLVVHWRDWWAWMRRSFAFGLLASAPFVLWTWGRNYRLVGNFVGPRQTQYDYIEPIGNLQLFYARIAQWFLPNTLTKRIEFGLIALVLLLALIVLGRQEGLQRWWRELVGSPNLITLIFSLFYFVFMIFVVATREHTEPYDDRYLVPLFIPLVLLVFHFLDAMIGGRVQVGSKWLRAGLVTGLVLWVAYQGFLSGRLILAAREEGMPYYNHFNTQSYRDSELLQRLEEFEFERGVPLYSNDAAAVYFYTGHVVRNSPSDSSNYVAADEAVAMDAQGWPREGRAYFAWLLPNWKKHYFSPEQLEAVAEFETLIAGEDGALYRVSSD